MRIPSLLAMIAVGALISCAHAQGSFTPVRIPIYLINISGSGAPEYKIGINLQLSDASGTTPFRTYEFDTGGTGFWAFPTTAPAVQTTGTLSNTYASGNTLTGDAVNATVTFETMPSSGTTAPVAQADIALISSATNSKKADSSINQWQSRMDSGQAPLENYFYGDFGMNLATGNGLFAVIPQLFGPQNTGFILHIGDVPTGTIASGTLSQGWIQVGLSSSEQLASSWSTVVGMVASGSSTYPNSGQPVYTEVLSTGTLTLSDATGTNSLPTGIVYDTGAPNTMIHSGTDPVVNVIVDSYNLDTGAVNLTLTGSGPSGNATLLDYVTGTTSGVNSASTSTVDAINYPDLYVNTGITGFFGRDVAFNIQDGFIGINPIPEPATLPLLGTAAALLASAAIWRRKRKRSVD